MSENFFEKFVKKNYNNELEKILEDKPFSEIAKNLLLGMLYKIEASYEDYKTVKRNVDTKDDYINDILDIIKKECDYIIIADQGELKNRTFVINKERKEIICYQIERKLLYAIFKINKKDIIVNNLDNFLCETISNAINIGNTINEVEPLRDFNGWSWTSVNRELESIEYNLIYQMLLILVRNKFLNEWVECKKEDKNYLNLLEKKLKDKMRRKK